MREMAQNLEDDGWVYRAAPFDPGKARLGRPGSGQADYAAWLAEPKRQAEKDQGRP